MNFAILEIKLVLIKLLKNYNVEPLNNETKVVFVEASNIRKPKGGLKCRFTKRK